MNLRDILLKFKLAQLLETSPRNIRFNRFYRCPYCGFKFILLPFKPIVYCPNCGKPFMVNPK